MKGGPEVLASAHNPRVVVLHEEQMDYKKVERMLCGANGCLA